MAISKNVTCGSPGALSTNSSIMYAPAPMTGGTKAPPVAAAAVIPPATSRLESRIPHHRNSKAACRDRVRNRTAGQRPHQATANHRNLSRGHRRLAPNTFSEKSMMNCVAPDISRNAPKMTNRNTNRNITLAAGPKTPSDCKNVELTICCVLRPRWGNSQSGKPWCIIGVQDKQQALEQGQSIRLFVRVASSTKAIPMMPDPKIG